MVKQVYCLLDLKEFGCLMFLYNMTASGSKCSQVND